MDNTITIQNIQEYTQQILNGNLILTRIIPFVMDNTIDEATICQRDYVRGSTLLECKINGVNNDIRQYKKLLIQLYSTTDMETILQNTILNISQQERYDKGFKYYPNLGVSIRGSNAERTLKEIINIIKIKNYNMELKIKLKNDEVIRFVI